MESDSTALAGACGTYCGACMAFHGELAAQAAALLDAVRRQGFLHLAKRLEPEQAGAIDAFLEVLDRIARTPACPGCGRGGGVADCPVRACARQRRLRTCADCDALADCAGGRGSVAETPEAGERRRRERLRDSGQAPFPFDAAGFLSRLVRKYGGWNLDNLRRIRAEGLSAWCAALASRPHWRTSEVKRDQDVFGDGEA